MTETPADLPDAPDPAAEGPLGLPDGTGLSARPDLQSAGAGGKDEPYAPADHVYDPADDLGLTTGRGTES